MSITSARRLAVATSKSPRKRDRDTTEAKILDTAEHLFASKGFDAVSTKQLASSAGVTIGALYHHFASKDALYEAVAKRAFSRGAVAPRTLFESPEAPEIRLKHLAAWFVRSIVSDKNFGLLLQRELLDPRAETSNLLKITAFQDALQLFKEIMRRLVPEGDVDKAVASMLALCFGFVNLKGIYAIVPGVRETLCSSEEIAAHATKLLLVGLRSSAGADAGHDA